MKRLPKQKPPALAPAVQRVVDAFVTADDARAANPLVIYASDGVRLKGFHQALARRAGGWTKPRTCIYRGCKKPSIKRSHSVQRGKALAQIADGGHVLTPVFKGSIVVEELGLNSASTFPGFCEQHEQLFAVFEQTGVLVNERDVALQLFRTLCREIVRRQYLIEDSEIELANYRVRRDQYYLQELRRVDPLLPAAKVTGNTDPVERSMLDMIEKLKKVNRKLEGPLYNEMFCYIDKGKPEPSGIALNVPVAVPVALSGIVLVDYRRAGRVFTAPCAICVIPQGGTTMIAVGTTSRHEKFLTLWRNQLSTALGMLSLVESWMVHGTDHWFLKPSIWTAISGDRQALLLDGMNSTAGAAGDPAPSIFDDLRLSLLAQMTPRLADLPAEERAVHAERIQAEADRLK